MDFSPHHTPAFIKAFKRVLKVAEKQGIDAGKLSFRDEMLKLGHIERVRNLYRIKDKLSQSAVFFVPNSSQDKYLKGKKGSDMILKPRQIGYTTLNCIRALDLTMWEENMMAGIMAHEQNKVTTIFSDITKFTYDGFKTDWGRFYAPKEKSDSATALVFEHDGLGRMLNSSLRVLFDFRGKTVYFLHVSEAAKIENERLNGSLNGVPDNGEIVLESTANGMGGEFYRQWQLSRKMGNLAPFKGHFIPWFEHYPEEPDHWVLAEGSEFTEYEKGLVEASDGLINEHHIAWRRAIIEKKCQGDPEVFEQEYPSNDIDCFLNGQNLVFGSSIIKNQDRHSRAPAYKCFLLSDGQGGIKLHEDEKGLISIWEKPDPKNQYVIGADPSGGVGRDNGAAYVLNRTTGTLVARIWGQLEPNDFASDLYKLGTYYNKAFINVEANNHGHAVIQALVAKNYRNLYKRRVMDEMTKQITNKIGFLTSNESKLSLTENFKTACKEGKLISFDKDLIAELTTFVQVASKTGRSIRREASGGSHDDLVMAACLTWEMHLSRGDIGEKFEQEIEREFDPESGFMVA